MDWATDLAKVRLLSWALNGCQRLGAQFSENVEANVQIDVIFISKHVYLKHILP